MRLTHELKTLTELRDYARMLLQEAEQMSLADADAGRSDEELRVRLTDNIDCARQLYAQRAALEGSAAAGLLDDQIAATIDASSLRRSHASWRRSSATSICAARQKPPDES